MRGYSRWPNRNNGGETESTFEMRRTTVRRLVYLVYILIGIIIAWDRGYLGLAFLKALVSVLLAIFLWWLVLLGVNLHIH